RPTCPPNRRRSERTATLRAPRTARRYSSAARPTRGGRRRAPTTAVAPRKSRSESVSSTHRHALEVQKRLARHTQAHVPRRDGLESSGPLREDRRLLRDLPILLPVRAELDEQRNRAVRPVVGAILHLDRADLLDSQEIDLQPR